MTTSKLKNRRRRKWIFRLTILIFIFGFFLVSAEISLRNRENYTALTDPTWLWSENGQLTRPINEDRMWFHPDTGVKHSVHWNELGVRGKTIDLRSNVTRVLLIGDSYCENPHLDDNHHLGAVLQELLNRSATGDWQVLNAGLYGSGPGTQLSFLRDLIDSVKPTVIVPLYCPNDIEDILVQNVIVQTAEGHYELKPKASSAMRSIIGHSYAVQWIRLQPLIKRELAGQLSWSAIQDADRGLYQTPPTPRAAKALLAYSWFAGQVKKLSTNHNAALIPLFVPMPYQFQHPEAKQGHANQIKKIWNDLDLEVIDPRERFEEIFDGTIYDNRGKLFFLLDSHWNELGTLEVAKLLLPKTVAAAARGTVSTTPELTQYLDGFEPFRAKAEKNASLTLHPVLLMRRFNTEVPESLHWISGLWTGANAPCKQLHMLKMGRKNEARTLALVVSGGEFEQVGSWLKSSFKKINWTQTADSVHGQGLFVQSNGPQGETLKIEGERRDSVLTLQIEVTFE